MAGLLGSVEHPIVLAPLAGGPSTPELTAAVADAGGFAFLAAGYLAPDALIERIATTRARTTRPFGVNLFVPGEPVDRRPVVESYRARIQPDAGRLGVALGEPRFDDDHWGAKVDLLLADPVGVVSFTFGCPSPELVERFRSVGTEVWVTVTTPEEAADAEAAGADVLVAQGIEAGGHRGSWIDDPAPEQHAVLDLVAAIRARTARPIAAGGGIAERPAVTAVLEAGADAAVVGTAFLRCPEAGTAAVHRAALAGDAPTDLTRAFTGRLARGIRNHFLDDHSSAAPSAYPEVHHLTAPLRAAGRDQGDASVVNLWAGTAYRSARAEPAADVIARLATPTGEP